MIPSEESLYRHNWQHPFSSWCWHFIQTIFHHIIICKGLYKPAGWQMNDTKMWITHLQIFCIKIFITARMWNRNMCENKYATSFRKTEGFNIILWWRYCPRRGGSGRDGEFHKIQKLYHCPGSRHVLGCHWNSPAGDCSVSAICLDKVVQ